MAEAFGVAAGVVGVLGLAIQITQVVTEFGLNWKDAPADVEGFRRELQSLKTVLSETNTNLLLNPDFKEAFEDRRSALLLELGPDAPPAAETKLSIESCKEELEKLLNELKRRGNGRRMGWERLKNAFLNKRVQGSIDKLRHHCEIFNRLVSIDTMTIGIMNQKEMRQARQEQREWHNAEQNQAILTWLSTLNFDEKQRDILSKRHPGTGRWLLDSDTFKAWRNGHDESPSTLWCPGIPGAGKSVMTSIVIESLQQMFAGEDVSISFAYCDYKDRTNQTTIKLISSLVKQVILQQKDMPEEVVSLYSAHGHGQSSLSLPEYLSLLSCFADSFRRSFILIDALDENFTNEDEEDVLQLPLLAELLKLQKQRRASNGYTLFFTSRENHVIQEQLAGASRLDIRAADSDIESYIRSRIANSSQFRFASKIQGDAELANTIVERLIEKAQGMFLLPRLHLDRLGCQTSIRNLRKALDSLPTKLNETYDEAMNRIQGQVQEHAQLALSALAWISNTLRPLKVDELKEALAIQPEDHELEKEAIPDEALIMSVSAGLLTIDTESETMRLVHFTVEEYFRESKLRWFPHAHTQIAETCLAYLSFDVFDSGRCLKTKHFLARFEENCLLEYAALNWGLHAARAERAIGDVALDFLLDNKKVSCASQILLQEDTKTYVPLEVLPYDFTGLHLAAYLGLTDLAKECLRAEPMVNSEDSDGRTPLSWAAERGNIAVVKLLIDQGNVLADLRDRYNRTPLLRAAEEGHTAVVKLLLDRDDIVTDLQDNDAHTLLRWAMEAENVAIIKQLLDQNDALANAPAYLGKTHLLWACEEGQEELVKILLDRTGVVADSQDEDGRTPVSWAAQGGHIAVVKLLLDRDDVVADHRDEDGCTPLSYAAAQGHTEVIKLLLDQGVAADAQNKAGQTPLMWAASRGQEEVVKLLLDQDHVVADRRDEDGRTPLSWAALRGHTKVVKLLLDHNVLADSQDKHGLTPLSWAASGGQEEVAKLLLDRDDVVADRQDKNGFTPLSYAAYLGHTKVVKLLLDHNVLADSQDKHGRTPLSWAASQGQEEVVKLLLNQDVVADSQDKHGRTPLSWAASQGQEEVVKLLLNQDVVADSQDKDGCTPLSYAAAQGHIEVIKLLLDHDVMADSQDKLGRTPLSRAASEGQEEVVKLLLDRDDVVADRQDKDGCTPLSYAASKGHTAVVELLVPRDNAIADPRDRDGPSNKKSEADRFQDIIRTTRAGDDERPEISVTNGAVGERSRDLFEEVFRVDRHTVGSSRIDFEDHLSFGTRDELAPGEQ